MIDVICLVCVVENYGTANERHFMMLKRAGRYLLEFSRVVQLSIQRTVAEWVTLRDADHAGCVRSCKLLKGVLIMFGSAVHKSVCRGPS